VVMDIAGIDPERVRVTTSDRSLVISGERRRDESGGRTYQQMEVEYGPFQRVIQLPEDADPANAEATYDKGLLRIVMPIAKPAPRERPVPIRVRRQP
jgi:HSP20 family protein